MKRIHKDFIVLGAGPAGLQIGFEMQEEGADYLIIERNETVGSFYTKFPRHGTLISINKVYTGTEDAEVNMRHDWNSLLSKDGDILFKDYTKEYFPPAKTIVTYLQDFAQRHDIRVALNTGVTSIGREDNGHFVLTTNNDRVYTCKHLVVATGFSKPYIPAIKGIEHAENYIKCSVNPEDYINQRVMIIGKGNSAFETADNLVGTASLIHMISPNPLQLAWKSHFVGHLRAVNNNFLDTYQLKSQNGIMTANIQQIRKNEEGKFEVEVSYALSGGEVRTYIYDHVLCCTGFQFDSSIFEDNCQPELCIDSRFPSQQSNWESINIENLHFAGTIMQSRGYKASTSGFIHGFRYNCRTLAHMLLNKEYNKHWRHDHIDHNHEAVTDFVIERINRTAALWQQFGYLADVIVADEENDRFEYRYELPQDYIHDTMCKDVEDYFTVSLEFGKKYFMESPDIFKMERPRADDIENAHKSAFLHPVVRRYSKGEMISERHLNENLDSEWNWPEVHVDVLRNYLKANIRVAATSDAT